MTLIQPNDAPDSFEVHYRVKVTISHDLRNGLHVGDEFEPCAATMDRSSLLPTLEWWNGQGHQAVLQKRVARTIYQPWEATN